MWCRLSGAERLQFCVQFAHLWYRGPAINMGQHKIPQAADQWLFHVQCVSHCWSKPTTWRTYIMLLLGLGPDSGKEY